MRNRHAIDHCCDTGTKLLISVWYINTVSLPILLLCVPTLIYYHHLRSTGFHSAYHPCFPISHPPLMSASARDAIFPADLLIPNDACKLLLSIAGFIYLTNYYPWCSLLCSTVGVHIRMCVSLHTAVIKYSSPCLFSQPYRSILTPSLWVVWSPFGLCNIHMHESKQPKRFLLYEKDLQVNLALYMKPIFLFNISQNPMINTNMQNVSAA